MINCGDFTAGSTLRFLWSTHGTDGSSITRATDGTIRIYKDSSSTERSSSAGITNTEDFDSQTGVHLCSIDLSDNTDSGFYAAGHDYIVTIVGTVIDGKTINAPIAMFSIENRNVTYQAKVWMVDDDSNTTDRYVVCWFKNGQPYAPTSGTPQIQIIKVSDGTDLVAATNMTQIASLGLWKYDASTRIVDGAGYIIKCTATVDGATRTWMQPISRDS